MFSKFFRTLALTISCSIYATGSSAQTDISNNIAVYGLIGALAELEATEPDNHFAIGALTTLRAVERSMQARWHYGIGQSFTRLPLLRMRLPHNRSAVAAQPDTVSNIFKQFLNDMEAAQTSLKLATENPDASFALRIGDLWFDMNADDYRDDAESAANLLAPFLLGRRQLKEAKKNPDGLNNIVINFDAADVDWLLAYTHLISSAAELYLSFDPTPVLTHLAKQKKLLKNVPRKPLPITLAEAEIRLEELKISKQKVREDITKNRSDSRALRKEQSRISKALKLAKSDAETAALLQEQKDNKVIAADIKSEHDQLAFALRDVANQKQDLYAKSPLANSRDKYGSANEFGSAVDLLYVLTESLRQDPAPDHLENARSHLLAMIAANKNFWVKVEAETDDDNEWIPNERQTSALRVNLPQGVQESWQAVLSDVEQVLHGELLVPHMFLPKGHGVNLKAYFDNPAPIDIFPMIHGIGFYPYVERGPRISKAAWSSFNRLMKGRGGVFAVFLN